jgi:hypothetical protein
MSSLTREIITERTGLKVRFNTTEELLALRDLLLEHFPLAAPSVTEEPKKVKKAKKAAAESADLLIPADCDSAGSSTLLALGATDPFRSNKYRLQSLNPGFCVGRKIDETNPILGTRPGDTGANGKVFPESQCAKKPVAGSPMCAICAKKEAEYLADTSKVPKGWYGRLDEPLFHKSFVVGCEWFLSKYPAGIEEAPVTDAPAAEKPKKAKKAKAAEPEVVAEAAPEAVAEAAPEAVAEKPKKIKKAKAAEPAPETAPEAAAEKPKKVKKAKAAEPEPAPEADTPESAPESAPAPKPVRKATVAATSAPRDVEWVTFISDGVPLIRNTKSSNVYQCDTSKHRLEDMVLRDKFEGKWRDGRLDPYAEEDEE